MALGKSFHIVVDEFFATSAQQIMWANEQTNVETYHDFHAMLNKCQQVRKLHNSFLFLLICS